LRPPRQDRVGRKLAGLDGAIDAREILVDHPASVDIEVPDFGVAHLAAWQPDRALGGIDGRVREVLPKSIPIRFTGKAHRIVGRRIAAAHAVEYHQQNRDHGVGVGHGGHRRNGE
jgi:hypothetical protein